VFHYKPNSLCFSLGTFGCNFRCKFCQNYDISYVDLSKNFSPTSNYSFQLLTPKQAVETAINLKSQGIAFTYNEPTIWLEFSLDCFKLAKGKKHLRGGGIAAEGGKGHLKDELYTVWVTNGYATKETIDLIAPYLDIYRVDLKSFDDSFYQKLINVPKASVVFETTKYLHDKYPKIHIECVTNIIPGANDSKENLKKIARFIYKNLGPLTPWHVTRFFPAAQMMDTLPTPPETIINAKKIGLAEGLAFVYIGNILTEKGENTYCPKCKTLNIERNGYQVKIFAVKEKTGRGYCQNCGQDLNLIL